MSSGGKEGDCDDDSFLSFFFLGGNFEVSHQLTAGRKTHLSKDWCVSDHTARRMGITDREEEKDRFLPTRLGEKDIFMQLVKRIVTFTHSTHRTTMRLMRRRRRDRRTDLPTG